jgi:hypothetical protein
MSTIRVLIADRANEPLYRMVMKRVLRRICVEMRRGLNGLSGQNTNESMGISGPLSFAQLRSQRIPFNEDF